MPLVRGDVPATKQIWNLKKKNYHLKLTVMYFLAKFLNTPHQLQAILFKCCLQLRSHLHH